MDRKIIRPSREWYIQWMKDADRARWEYYRRLAETREAIKDKLINV